MRRAIRQPLAVVFALLVVTAGALGTVMLADSEVQTVEEASNQFVQRGAAFSPSDGVILGYAAGAIEAYQDFIGDNQPTDQLNATDWNETHTNIWQATTTQDGNNDAHLTTMENYLNDTRSIALMVGKKAYVESLNNGATQGEAELAAYDAVEGYYLTKQQNTLASWNMTIETFRNANSQMSSSPSDFYQADLTGTSDTLSGGRVDTTQNDSVTLVDGTTITIREISEDGTDNSDATYHPGAWGSADRLYINPPSGSGLSKATIANSRFASVWSKIQTQNTEVKNQLTTFINATYDNYQAGELNASDFVDPYMGARDYSPETSNTFTLRSLSAMGVNPPENLSNIGLMNVSVNGTVYRGVLMSQGTPSGGFAINQTYNASNITGPQWVALDDGGAQELTGEFTLKSAERADGTAYTENETVTYTNVTYDSTNLTELKSELNESRKMLAEINARQQELRNSGGSGWLPDFGSIDLGSVAPVVVIAGGALVLLGRN